MMAKVMVKLSKLKTGARDRKMLQREKKTYLFTMFSSRCSVHKHWDYPLKLDQSLVKKKS